MAEYSNSDFKYRSGDIVIWDHSVDVVTPMNYRKFAYVVVGQDIGRGLFTLRNISSGIAFNYSVHKMQHFLVRLGNGRTGLTYFEEKTEQEAEKSYQGIVDALVKLTERVEKIEASKVSPASNVDDERYVVATIEAGKVGLGYEVLYAGTWRFIYRATSRVGGRILFELADSERTGRSDQYQVRSTESVTARYRKEVA